MSEKNGESNQLPTEEQKKIFTALNELEVGTFIICDERMFKKVAVEKGVAANKYLTDDYLLVYGFSCFGYLLELLIRVGNKPEVLIRKKLAQTMNYTEEKWKELSNLPGGSIIFCGRRLLVKTNENNVDKARNENKFQLADDNGNVSENNWDVYIKSHIKRGTEIEVLRIGEYGFFDFY